MKTTHRTTIIARCPHGGTDVYDAEFEVSDGVLTVEKIQTAIEAKSAEPVYQEVLTQCLADTLGCIVVTVGRHGRFLTTCRAEAKGRGVPDPQGEAGPIPGTR